MVVVACCVINFIKSSVYAHFILFVVANNCYTRLASWTALGTDESVSIHNLLLSLRVVFCRVGKQAPQNYIHTVLVT